MSTIHEIAEKIAAVEGVKGANVWEKAGHSRIYIELPKLNGGKDWNGGRAGTVWYDAADGAIHEKGDWAGAKTRDAGREIIARIEAVL